MVGPAHGRVLVADEQQDGKHEDEDGADENAPGERAPAPRQAVAARVPAGEAQVQRWWSRSVELGIAGWRTRG